MVVTPGMDTQEGSLSEDYRVLGFGELNWMPF